MTILNFWNTLKKNLLSKINEWNLCHHTNKELNDVYLKKIYSIMIYYYKICWSSIRMTKLWIQLTRKLNLVVIDDQTTVIRKTDC